VCVSLLDHCLGQDRLVGEEGCAGRCPGDSVPDVNGEKCRDDTELVRPVLMMTGLKEILETQLINLRRSLDTSGLGAAIRDIEQIPSLAGLAQGDYEILTDGLATLYNVQNSDIILNTYFKFFTDRLNMRIGRVEDALHETRSGNNKINTVLRNIRNLYKEFVYKIKDLNDEIERKRDSVTEAFTKVAVFDEMLAGVKQEKRSLNTVEMVEGLFSKIKTTFIEVDNEYKANGTKKAVFKTLDSLPGVIRMGVSLFNQPDANRGREIKNKIQRSLKAVGSISSRLSSANWELIQTAGSFLAMRDQAVKLKAEEFGPRGASVSDDLIAESLSRCRELRELAQYL